MSEEPFTRDSLIADDHVKIAISNLKTMWSDDEEGNFKEIPIPQSVKDSGVLPEGYCVDFAHDPATTIRSLASIGIKSRSQLGEAAFKDIKAIVNGPKNLAIVPTHVRDEKLRATIEALGPLEPAADANSA